MISAASVQAKVVDIHTFRSTLPSQIVTDAQILYWVFYPNFQLLQYAGGKYPLAYQVREYPHFWKLVTQAKRSILVTPATLGEFARVASMPNSRRLRKGYYRAGGPPCNPALALLRTEKLEVS